MILDRKKQVGNQTKSTNKLHDSPTPSESSISVGEDNSYGSELLKVQECSAYSQAYVQPDKTLLDFLLEEDELNSMCIHKILQYKITKKCTNKAIGFFNIRYGTRR